MFRNLQGNTTNNCKSSERCGKSGRGQTSSRRTLDFIGWGWPLPPDPDPGVIAQAKTCPHDGGAMQAHTQHPHAVYHTIALPPMQPIGTRVEQPAGPCPPLWSDL